MILIKPNDPKSWLNKVKYVMNVADEELGYVAEERGNFNISKVVPYLNYNFVCSRKSASFF